ncbi:hypothetical protein A3F29_04400 [Candidatus Roizmanbacteria bacterium RIFCSPHIGHO2_12_FULL_33_9]|uniref:methionyl-tRNA formyltransferase n=1 Tax=Candidatus Roizmanbacteria bacterium RIFCSPHIGHO2_12_FULL_33_9 TaxID=1802045 RepID=A0A1F7HJ09_9BACT|nr:MAG: hypothetical protein A3F29_04400 [Candidatus Roizmanbacteria bacterium RIFCSPHIGHO2_12_FULL_33_9]
MHRLKALYFGTPDFSADFLKKVLDDKDILVKIDGVVTQNDKKVGRKQILTQSSVKKLAIKNSIEVYHDFSYKKFDLGLIFSFGRIIPKEEFKKFKYGIWVIHPSLLPKYRGASPIAQTLINGDTETGVTIIQADEGVDTGDILGQIITKIKPNENRNELTIRLTNLGYDLFKETTNSFVKNNFKINTIKQDNNNYSVSKKLEKENGFVAVNALQKSITSEGQKIYNLYKGLYPWPGIWTLVKIGSIEKRLKITEIELFDKKINIKKVQLDGKKEVDFKTFNSAYNIFT